MKSGTRQGRQRSSGALRFVHGLGDFVQHDGNARALEALNQPEPTVFWPHLPFASNYHAFFLCVLRGLAANGAAIPFPIADPRSLSANMYRAYIGLVSLTLPQATAIPWSLPEIRSKLGKTTLAKVKLTDDFVDAVQRSETLRLEADVQRFLDTPYEYVAATEWPQIDGRRVHVIMAGPDRAPLFHNLRGALEGTSAADLHPPEVLCLAWGRWRQPRRSELTAGVVRLTHAESDLRSNVAIWREHPDKTEQTAAELVEMARVTAEVLGWTQFDFDAPDIDSREEVLLEFYRQLATAVQQRADEHFERFDTAIELRTDADLYAGRDQLRAIGKVLSSGARTDTDKSALECLLVLLRAPPQGLSLAEVEGQLLHWNRDSDARKVAVAKRLKDLVDAGLVTTHDRKYRPRSRRIKVVLDEGILRVFHHATE